ncbi:hypothetical protein [Pseudarthrobacter phenanthrenivorans]|uniref:Uncharacterized protein n=1 Tax=Pseudarthrobacter phenanthrenivorans TaxID=361575 RepID=A0A0B4EPR0_PSEPS|nr:hypothetical protein [Pseudarthrobacter phenanthrenivorans]KIC68693.1 hypothetical protein RM50_04330 [Pseudarthrobacter phenanthrenivorans]
MAKPAAKAARGRPSKGLRGFIGFRVQEKTADEVAFIAASKGITVTDYVSDALAKQLARDKKRPEFRQQQQNELPIQLAS